MSTFLSIKIFFINNIFFHIMSNENSPRENKDPDANVKCQPLTLKPNEWLSGTVYYQILSSNGNSQSVVDSYGNKLSVGNSVLGNEMISASQYDTEERVTRSDMVDKLLNAGSCVFTVTFKKQLTGERVQELLEEEKYDGQPPAKKRKLCDKVLKSGETREMVAYLLSTEHNLGRTNCIDLNLPANSYRVRQVDHRTVESLILRRVKYTLKK
jgi:hypothetical protein